MTHRTNSCRGYSTGSGSKTAVTPLVFILLPMVVVVTVMMSMVSMVVMLPKTSLEREPDELRFVFEPERGVDDELSDIVKTPVNRQYVDRVWVLRDRRVEDISRELGREVGEGRHWRVPWLSVCLEGHRQRDGDK